MHNLAKWVTGTVAVLILLAVAGPYIDFHFIARPALAKLTLPKHLTGSISAADQSETGASSSGKALDGTWHLAAGSVVGFRVEEFILFQHSTVVGRTKNISGSLTVSGNSVNHGSFTVEVASLATDKSERNVMDATEFPTATFSLTRPIDLRLETSGCTIACYSATGNLTMRGVSKEVTITLVTECNATSIYVVTDVPIAYADWKLPIPGGRLAGIASPGTLEVLLHLMRDVR